MSSFFGGSSPAPAPAPVVQPTPAAPTATTTPAVPLATQVKNEADAPGATSTAGARRMLAPGRTAIEDRQARKILG